MTQNDERTCSRCDHTIDRPIQKNANYAIHTDFAEPEQREVHYAMVHTEETMAELDRVDKALPERSRESLSAEQASPHAPEKVEVSTGTEVIERDDGGTVETAKSDEITFSVPMGKYDHVEVADPEIVKESEEVARVYTQYEEREVQKTGLVCPDCVKDDDQILWGPDK